MGDFTVPGWLQVAGGFVTLVLTPLLALLLTNWRDRAKDRVTARNTADIEMTKVEHSADSEERKLKNDEWVQLLEQRKQAHEADVARLEKAQTSIFKRVTHLERRDEECQETVGLLRSEIDELRAGGTKP